MQKNKRPPERESALGPEESEYFLLLVQRARAGTKELQKHLDRKIEKARAEREVLAKRVPSSAALSEEAKAIFYSNWQYSAVRIASSIPSLGNAEALARRLGPQDMFYSGVVSLSAEDLKAFRKELVELVARFVERVKDSPSERLACLNLDWFEVRK